MATQTLEDLKMHLHNNCNFHFEVAVQPINMQTFQDPLVIMPRIFVQQYAIYFNQKRSFHKFVLAGTVQLRCAATQQEWTVDAECYSDPFADRGTKITALEEDAIARSRYRFPVVRLRKGWGTVAAAKSIVVGDVLLFVMNPTFDAAVHVLQNNPPPMFDFDVHIFRNHAPSFVKTLANKRAMTSLYIPKAFVVKHGSRFAIMKGRRNSAMVELQGVPGALFGRDGVRCRRYRYKSRKQITVCLMGREWRDFVRLSNDLRVGQKLKFTLVADKLFVVEAVE